MKPLHQLIPEPGTASWKKAFKKALEHPNFNYTPPANLHTPEPAPDYPEPSIFTGKITKQSLQRYKVETNEAIKANKVKQFIIDALRELEQ